MERGAFTRNSIQHFNGPCSLFPTEGTLKDSLLFKSLNHSASLPGIAFKAFEVGGEGQMT